MKIRFDRDLITEQMNALGLSERAVISRTGIPNFTFRQARQTGLLEGTLTLRQVSALADVLALTVSQLLSDAEDEEAPSDQSRSAADDAATLIPLLVHLPRVVSVAHLTRAMQWPRPRVTSALDATPHALRGTGLRHHRDGFIKIVAVRPTDRTLKQALGRVRQLGLGLNSHEADVLTRILDGHNVLDRMPSNATRVAVGSLQNMGCIALNDDGIFEATADLRLAMPDV